MVDLLGYDYFANKAGGYPAGYLNEASRLGISKNIDLQKAAITHGELADIIVGSFDVDVLVKKMDSKDGYSYDQNGDSILSAYMGINKVKGIVQAVGESSFSTVEGVQGRVVIDGVMYIDNIGLNMDFLGCPVEAYIKSDKNKNELIALKIDDYKYNTLSIDYDELEGKSGLFTKTTIVYSVENKLKTENLSPSVEVIYNGFALGADYSIDDLLPEYGYIQLIDNKDDKVFDVVKVWEYEGKPIKKVFESERQIVFTDTSSFDSDSYDGKIITLINGKPDDIRNMKQGMLLLMAYSKDGKNLVINALNNSVTGTVARVNKNNVEINGKKYKAVPNDIIAGAEGTFYLDEQDRIVIWEKQQSSSEKYGYIIDFEVDSSIEKVTRVLLLTTEDERIPYTLKSKVTYNGNRYSAENVARLLKGVRTLIRYKTDSNGLIHTIKTPKDNTTNKNGYNKDAFTLDYKNKSIEYNHTSGSTNQYTFSKYYIGGADTVIMRVAGYKDPSIDEFRVVNKNSFTGLSTKYNIEVYDSNEGFAPKVVVVISSSPYFKRETSNIKNNHTKYNATSAIITENRGQMLLNEEIVDCFEVYQSCTLTQLKAALDTAFVWDNVMDTYIKDDVQTYPCPHPDGYFIPSRDFSPGDIIQYELNGNGLLQSLRVIYKNGSTNALDQLYSQKLMSHTDTGEAGTMTFEGFDYWYRGSYMAVGKVVATDRERAVYKVGENEYRSFNMTLSTPTTPNCFLYDSVAGKIRLYSPLELMVGDTVVLHTLSAVLGSAVVLK